MHTFTKRLLNTYQGLKVRLIEQMQTPSHYALQLRTQRESSHRAHGNVHAHVTHRLIRDGIQGGRGVQPDNAQRGFGPD